MKLLVTGAGGLIGSEVSAYFSKLGWSIFGIDNNMRKDFFGISGDISWNIKRLKETLKHFHYFDTDIRNRNSMLELISEIKPDAVIHTAAQPSHDLAAKRPFDDFDVNALGTLNLLESMRRINKDAPFIHMSTNKVYGDSPNKLNLIEKDKRFDFKDEVYVNGINESFSIDQCKHSLFGASKVAADIMVQEYGRYFNMPTCCLRGGCLTGPNHSGVELHGFLSYLIKCNVQNIKYNIYGYKGKQVRDNIHSYDVCRFIHEFLKAPKIAEVYNLGGGRNNSISILEAFDKIYSLTGEKVVYEYIDKNREGDHICYISDLSKMLIHYPSWSITKNLEDIFNEIHDEWIKKSR